MTTTILIAIAAFLVITLVLVALLLYAKAKLVASGEVTIDINNGERVITTESGSTLLSTLADNKVFLPSACGGGGSCGMCKCQVLEGGGDILPTETGFISRKLAKDHWRLGCQVKVKENLKIHVPEAVLGVKKWECTVVSNRNISTFLKEFVVKLPEGENLKFRSGGYIQIDIPKYDAIRFSDMDIDERYREDWDKMKMWDSGDDQSRADVPRLLDGQPPGRGQHHHAQHPYRHAAVRPCRGDLHEGESGHLLVVHLLAQAGRQGDHLGSLRRILPARRPARYAGADLHRRRCGHGSDAQPHHAPVQDREDEASRVVLVRCARAEGGSLSGRFPRRSRRISPTSSSIWRLDRPDPEADAAGVNYTPGFVHNVLYENYLKNHQAPEDCIYLMCGPPMMIASVVKMLDSLGVPPENILYDNFGS